MNQKKVLLSHPYGNPVVRNLLPALDNEGLLEKYFTIMATDKDSVFLNLLPKSIRDELLRRTFPIEKSLIDTSNLKLIEITRKLLNKLGYRNRNYDLVEYINRSFDLAVSKKMEKMAQKGEVGYIYAFEDIALDSFKMAKQLGIKCVYDLPIGYWEYGRKLLSEEAERLPEWSITLTGGIDDPQPKLDRKVQEMELADLVISPSKFVKDSIPDWVDRDKILISPFGTPISTSTVQDVKEENADRPLRVLFVGTMSQRKGLGDLFSAMKLLDSDKIELVVLGSLLAPMKFYREQFPNFTYEVGRPHAEVLELMKSCDVFCLPSIVEGRALVMQEAMSQGLPLIITSNTGGDDLILEGKTGFLIPVQSPEVIAEKLEWFLKNRDKLPEMSNISRQHASKYTWEDYGKKITQSLTTLA